MKIAVFRKGRVNLIFIWAAARWRTLKTWFEIVASDTVIELGEGPLIIEEL